MNKKPDDVIVLVSSLDRRIESLESRAAEEDEAGQREYLFQAVGAMFEKAATYLAILQAAGYAAFFGIWEGAREYLTRAENLWCAGLVGFSLVVFICWHVILNFTLARQQFDIARLATSPPEKFKDAAAALRSRGDRLRARLALFFLPVNLLMIVPAVVGMGVLLWNVAERLLDTL
ncbi:MAG TPA: hypothetical protein VFB63_26010 [Bryobacteraceae bacterium]|nr:hypothetical protein [Bryobacteraceae bacterium]